MYGDKLSDQYLKDAEEIYHLKIPERFRTLAGQSAPPNSWTLAAWLHDLQARFNHMEKILYQVRTEYFSSGSIKLKSLSRISTRQKNVEPRKVEHIPTIRGSTFCRGDNSIGQ